MPDAALPVIFGGQTMFGPLRRVLVRPPSRDFAVSDPEKWNYSSAPDLSAARSNHETLVARLREFGAEIIEHTLVPSGLADSVFVFDPVLITDGGIIRLRMGKELRRGEEGALAEKLEASGVPTVGRICGEGSVEGGDLFWLDPQTLVAGRGFRTNDEGIRQLREILSRIGISLHSFDLPYYEGPRACLHLLSCLSLLDRDLAAVYLPLLPVGLWEILRRKGVEMVPVPDHEFLTLGTNLLALEPRVCLAVEGNLETKERLEAAGCEVRTYEGGEISLKAEGGPTCLTLPLLRDYPGDVAREDF